MIENINNVKQYHPVGAMRWYRHMQAEVIDYDDSDRDIMIRINVEDNRHGGFRTIYCLPEELTESP